MLKIPACICFIIGCFGFGYGKIREYKKHYEELVYIRYILNLLLLEIENKRGTLGEICLVLASKLREPYRAIFKDLFELLEKERKKTPRLYWEEKIKELASYITLKKEEKDILQSVIRCAEGTVPKMPMEVLRESISEWDKVIAKAEQTKNEKSKVTMCLSITTGLLLCVLVI